jgi:hypothetical protein
MAKVYKQTPICKRRIATVKATGERLIVERLDIPKKGPAHAFCFAVVGVHKLVNGGARVRYDHIRKFLRSAVDIEEVVFTWETAQAIWEETMQRQGYIVRKTRGGNYKAEKPLTQKQIEDRRALAKAVNKIGTGPGSIDNLAKSMGALLFGE